MPDKFRGVDPVALRSKRETAGFTQASAARELGWSRQRLWNLEHGFGCPSAINLQHMSNLYGCQMEDLMLS